MMRWIFILQLIVTLVFAVENDTSSNNATTEQTTWIVTTVSEYDYSSYSGRTTDPPTELPPCGSFELTDPSGSFNSPQHPGRYHPNQDCVWQISVAKGMKIELTVSNIDIELQSSSCKFDVLKVFDGASENASEIAQICHRGRNSTVIRSSGNQLTVTFHSDGDIGGDGFTATYVSKSCFNLKVLKNGGDVKWFKLSDEPKTKASNLKKVLLGGKKKDVYKGLSKKDVTFKVQGKSKFTLQEVSLKTRFASGIQFKLYASMKGSKTAKVSSKSIPKSNDLTSTKLSNPKKIQRFTVSIQWDTELQGKGKDKINVKDFTVQACLDK